MKTRTNQTIFNDNGKPAPDMPNTTASDSGKVLGVDESGKVVPVSSGTKLYRHKMAFSHDKQFYVINNIATPLSLNDDDIEGLLNYLYDNVIYIKTLNGTTLLVDYDNDAVVYPGLIPYFDIDYSGFSDFEDTVTEL